TRRSGRRRRRRRASSRGRPPRARSGSPPGRRAPRTGRAPARPAQRGRPRTGAPRPHDTSRTRALAEVGDELVAVTAHGLGVVDVLAVRADAEPSEEASGQRRDDGPRPGNRIHAADPVPGLARVEVPVARPGAPGRLERAGIAELRFERAYPG